eukprot:CAMPEP_0184377414 /NCGR_PEP_ID=MMETSP0007-20130409/2248_1 /TAXON_ID=97485 /ORGANISM="Prymnesium parvum, Strain Texoma1" /LENGTH=80 /DNA_ID=CAMNT_0026721297 /DNA_START=281 /DNA_END=520 /DNA_ORIENTATION=+
MFSGSVGASGGRGRTKGSTGLEAGGAMSVGRAVGGEVDSGAAVEVKPLEVAPAGQIVGAHTVASSMRSHEHAARTVGYSA